MTDTRSLIPTNGEFLHEEGHPMLGYRVFDILGKIIQHKQDLGLPDKWNRNYELGKNRHWRQASKKASLVSANLLHTHRTRTVNMLTDNNPTFNIKATGNIPPEKNELYNVLLKTSEWWWLDTEQQAVLEETVINGETYGLTIEKMLFNPDLEQNIGEVEAVLVDPFHFGWWPIKQNNVQKCEALFHFWPMSIMEAKRRWPDKKDQMKTDKELLEKLNDNRLEVQSNSLRGNFSGYMTTFANAVKNVLNIAGGETDESDECLVCECWVKDYTRISDDGKEFDKYKGNIRRVTVMNAGGLVVDDRDNPSINPNLEPEQAIETYLWDKFPFNKTHSVTDTGNPWGMSDFEQLEMLNIEVNKTISQFTLVKDRVSRVKLINPQDSGVANSELNNAPGIINPSSSLVSQAIRYLDPPRIDLNILEALKVYKEFFFLVSGSFDLEQADTTGKNVIAYKALAALLERAATMLRGKLRNYSKLIRERGRMYISLMQNWYTEKRFITYDQDGSEVTAQIMGRDLIIPARLTVVSGSTMPVSKIQQREEALGLFDKGAIDVEELLKAIEWPEWKKVVNRMNQGPIGMMLQKLGMIGVPPELLELFQEISQMEEKEVESSMEKGELPTFPQIIQMAFDQTAGVPQLPPPEQLEAERESAKTDAEIRKIDAEIMLIEEKINTERVNQAATSAGIKFDQAKLTQEQAKTISDIKAQQKDLELRDKEIAVKKTESQTKEHIAKKSQGPFRERGMKSDNKKKK